MVVAKVKYSTAGECLEVTLREMLLDLEDRVHGGSLGTLKVTSHCLLYLSQESILVAIIEIFYSFLYRLHINLFTWTCLFRLI